MTRKRSAYLHIIILPFIVSASIEFLPTWLVWPIGLLCSMAWIGGCAILAEKDET